MLATFMEVLDTSVANVSLPHIAGNLSASNDEATWVLTSYLVSNAIVLPLSGWFSALIGRKRFYMTCVAIFTISSLLCGLAPSLGSLVFFRILQGAGGGALQPVSQAILVESFPRTKHGHGHGRLRHGRRRRAHSRADPRRLDHRQLLLAMDLPHQHPRRRDVAGAHLCCSSPDSPYSRKKKGPIQHRLHRTGAHRLGLGCLQIMLDKGEQEDWFGSPWITTLAVVIGRVARGRDHLGTPAEGPAGRSAAAEEPQLRPGHCHHVLPGLRALRQHDAAAAVPADADGLRRDAQRAGALARRVGRAGGDATGWPAHWQGAGAMDARCSGW